jgi:hypothetical protein
MTKTSVIRMLSAATKATNVDNNITLGCMIAGAEKCQQATPTIEKGRLMTSGRDRVDDKKL